MSQILHRYTILRNQLDELGYAEPLPKDGLRLVDRLVSDIIKANDKLAYYKALANTASDERDALLLGTQPFETDNAKLLCEVTDLTAELNRVTENAELKISKLKTEIRHLNNINNKLDNDNKMQEDKIQQLELELATKINEILKLKNLNCIEKSDALSKLKKPALKPTLSSNQNSNKEMIKLKTKCEKLDDDINILLDSQQQQLDLINSYKKLLERKDQEIIRLTKFIENRKTVHSSSNDQIGAITLESLKSKRYDQLNDSMSIQSESLIKKYESQLNEAITKQNETLIQNINLLEKNKQLEKELHDIDQIALNVEKRCNESLQSNKLILQSKQDELNASIYKISLLQQKIIDITNEKDNLASEINLLKNKKIYLSQYCQTDNLPINANKSYLMQNDKFTSVSDMISEKCSNAYEEKHEHNFSRCSQKCQCQAVPEKECVYDDCLTTCRTSHTERNNLNDHVVITPCDKLYSSSYDPRHTKHTFSSWQKSHDKHLHTYPIKSAFCKDNCICIKCFHSINNLISCLDKKLTISQSELLEVQTERDNLRRNLESTVEMQVSEHSKLHKKYMESLEKIEMLEFEHKELLKNKEKQIAIIENLQKHCSELKDQLCLQEQDINNHKISYNQLKIVYDQTEKTLTKYQQQLCDKEHDLALSKESTIDRNQENRTLKEKNKNLQMELNNIKLILDRTSKEKIQHLNELDEKCEQLERIKDQKHSMETELTHLRKNIKELKMKFDDVTNSRDLLENSLTRINSEGTKYCEELDKLRRDCKNYSIENMRLIDELTSLKCEQRQTLDALESSKKESRELQQQLQQYVARVRHAEDVIAMKEAERSDLLEQFRSLSQEATILESNNHTLETYLADTKKKLNAQGYLSNNLIEEKEKTLQDMQDEIHSNSTKFSTLEAEVEHYKKSAQKAKDDLSALLKVCDELRVEKDRLFTENRTLNCNYNQIKDRIEKLKRDLDKEISTKEGLESLLESSRQEAIDYHLKVVEQTNELTELHNKLQTLISKLENEKELSQRFQAQSHAFKSELQELKRKMHSEYNERIYERDFYTTI